MTRNKTSCYLRFVFRVLAVTILLVVTIIEYADDRFVIGTTSECFVNSLIFQSYFETGIKVGLYLSRLEGEEQPFEQASALAEIT